ncbi:MAG: hypothetical protein OXH49_11320 [Gemmatimonadetes bacterium]|nr:hypothetical protein [Gemmatimonadota bacterium]
MRTATASPSTVRAALVIGRDGRAWWGVRSGVALEAGAAVRVVTLARTWTTRIAEPAKPWGRAPRAGWYYLTAGSRPKHGTHTR